MSKIEEMLKNEKVEWKEIGDIPEIKVITVKKKLKKQEYLREGDYPIIDQGQEFIVGYTNDNDAIIDKYPCVIFGDHTESIKYVDFAFAQGADGIKILKTDEEYIKSRYLYHTILSYYKLEGKYMRHFSLLRKTLIPIPSLKTQEKIVKTLDKFTEYVTELQAELQAELQYRTNQYEYYRNMLLSEEYLNKLSKKLLDVSEGENRLYCSNPEYMRELVEVKLETIVKIKNGKDWKKLGKGNIPVYGSGGNMDIYVDKYSYDKPSVLIPRKGSIENVFYLEEPFWNVDTIFYTEIDESKIIPRYLYYFISNYDMKSLSTDSTRPSLTQEALNRIVVQLPPLSLQNKIVEILDKFQAMLSKTKGLLPKEIEERQKQYEYYREKLLTFDIESGTHARTHATNR